MLVRALSSRIFYGDKFFSYPLRPFEALLKLGVFSSTLCILSWLKARLFPVRHPRNFEEWVSNQFGKRLFNIFFKSYTEKVWGMKKILKRRLPNRLLNHSSKDRKNTRLKSSHLGN